MTTQRSPITTHVLDTSLGRPAAGIAVTLSRMQNDAWQKIAEGKTDDDGRVSTLLQPGTLTAGAYKIVFSTASYFEASKRSSFYPHVDIVFNVSAADEHYHVPLLLNPFGYSTYRGS
ncbi:MAG: hydroxyisourate hydrolase [Sandaracinaceae bacterium]|jgi:5-hydroxyisourate hydrolase|nr:hydroxyisourate hydrolase [Sandaracinaceae bacterium]